jgi:hypothetical protein
MILFQFDSIVKKKIMLCVATAILFVAGVTLVGPTEKLLQKFLDLARITFSAFG